MDSNTPQQEQTKLEDLDLFSLLRLEHLSNEEKAQRLVEIQEVVLTNFLQEDLPKLLSEEDLKTFQEMAKDPQKSAEVEKWLQEKIPGLDQIMREKMLAAKKEIVRENMLTRLDLNTREAQDPEVQKNDQRMEELVKEKETLEKIISAIDSDDWGQASSLIQSL